jgi:hypothetical protein
MFRPLNVFHVCSLPTGFSLLHAAAGPLYGEKYLVMDDRFWPGCRPICFSELAIQREKTSRATRQSLQLILIACTRA